MNGRDYVRLGLRILDEQVVDSEGRRCGRVEDLELDGRPGSPCRVVAILCGATAWKRRLPSRMAELIPGDPDGLCRVPWDQVEEIHNEIILKIPEGELQKAASADAAPLAVSQLIGTTVVGSEGKSLGKIRDVIASRPAGSDVEVPWELYGLLLGRKAVLQRAGFSPLLQDELQEGRIPPNFLSWPSIQRFGDEGNLVAR